MNFSNFAPRITRHLILINLTIWLAQMVLSLRFGIDLIDYAGLHYWSSDSFSLLQLVSYMFLHSTDGPAHVIFNMLSLWMFGSAVENRWGEKRYLIYYLTCGISAGLVQELSWMYDLRELSTHLGDMVRVGNFVGLGYDALSIFTTVGASGAIFGLLLAFGMLFPDAKIFFIFLPIPIKAKFFVVIYGIVELLLGVSDTMTSIAHFAHLGGILGGIILILLWRKHGRIDSTHHP